VISHPCPQNDGKKFLRSFVNIATPVYKYKISLKLTKDKHSSSFLYLCNKEKKFYNIDTRLSSRPAKKSYNYGYYRAEALGALFTVVLVGFLHSPFYFIVFTKMKNEAKVSKKGEKISCQKYPHFFYQLSTLWVC